MALARAASLRRLALWGRCAAAELFRFHSICGGAVPLGAAGERRASVSVEPSRLLRCVWPPTAQPQARSAHSGGRATREQLELNKAIMQCASVDAVLDLFAAHAGVANGVNAATALLTVSRRRGPRETPAWLKSDQRFRQLLKTLRTLMSAELVDAQALSNALYACGQLGIAPPSSWMQTYWHASAALLGDFKPQNFSNTLYACGQLALTPPDDWLPRFWHVSASELGDFKPQELSNTLYACGKLSIMPPVDWLERFWLASAAKLVDFKPQELSNTLYACGQLNILPPDDWLERFWLACDAKLGDFVPQALSNTLYACGQLGIRPPTDWMQRYWHASAATLCDFVPQALSNTLYACGQLGLTPPGDWLERFWHASAPKLGDFKPQNLSNTLYACGQLGVTPPADWLERFWHFSAAKLGDFKPQELSNALYACGQLGVTPPAYWLPRFWHASAATLGDFIPQHFSNTLYACGQLGITPPADWLERFWQASAATLGSFTPQALSNTLYACGLLDTQPPADWLERFSSAWEQALSGMNLQDWANTAFALAMTQLWELPLWLGLWERLCSALSRDIAGWSAEDQLNARQMYQAYQAAAVERPGLLPAPSPELLAAARKDWIDRVRDGEDNTRAGRFHDDVSACLTRMGVAHANERWCDRAERSIDIAIEGGATPIALEVDGPSHFLQDGRPDGSTLLRNRTLAAHGWRVVVVDYRVWNTLQTQQQREEYLRRVLTV